MLPKANRLRHQRDFNAVYQQGSRRQTPHLALRAWNARSRDGAESTMPTRIGIVVGQKVSKRAAVRNRIKRQLRAALRQLLPRLSSGWKIVAIARPQAEECDYDEFLRELEQLLADAEVLNGHSRGSLL